LTEPDTRVNYQRPEMDIAVVDYNKKFRDGTLLFTGKTVLETIEPILRNHVRRGGMNPKKPDFILEDLKEEFKQTNGESE